MTLTPLPSPLYSGADLAARVDAATAGTIELRARTAALEAATAKRFDSVAAFLADTAGYGPSKPQYAVDDVFTAGGFSYRVVAADAPVAHLSNAGGVRVIHLPAPGPVDVRALGAALNDTTEDWTAFTQAWSYFDTLTAPAGSKVWWGAGAGLTLSTPANRRLSFVGQDIQVRVGRVSAITGITQANPVVVTSPAHGFATGDTIQIADVVGMNNVNGKSYRVNVLGPDTLALQTATGTLANIDGTAFNAYVSGGSVVATGGRGFRRSSRVVASTILTSNITGVTQANPAVVTTSANHGRATGDQVFIANVLGMTQLNGQIYRVTVLSPTTYSLQTVGGANIDSTGFSAYTSGGRATTVIGTAGGLPVAGTYPNPLLAPVPRGATTCRLAILDGVTAGDLLNLTINVPVETGWSYVKREVRRIVKVDTATNTVTVDKAFDFPWDPTEGDRNGVVQIAVYVIYPPSAVTLDGIKFIDQTAGSNGLSFTNLSGVGGPYGVVLRNITGDGLFAKWGSSCFSDVLAISGCDGVLIEQFQFRKGRYFPNMTGAARNILIRDGVAEDVRHLDANAWVQDLEFQRVRGIRTDGILQCHPSIRVSWIDCDDQVSQGGLYGFDPRCVGGYAEGCFSVASHGGTGNNTQAMSLRGQYVEWARNYSRTVRRCRFLSSGILAGNDGSTFVEDCEALQFGRAALGNQLGRIYLDERSRITGPRRRSEGLAGFANAAAPDKPIQMNPIWPTTEPAGSAAISGVTKANPGVFSTATPHGLVPGDVATLAGLVGMTNGNGVTYRVLATPSATTFTLRTLGGDPVNTTNWGTWTSGGTVTRLRLTAPAGSVFTADSSGAIEGIVADSSGRACIVSAGHTIQAGTNFVYLDGIEDGPAILNGSLFRAELDNSSRFRIRYVSGGAYVMFSELVEPWVSGGTWERRVAQQSDTPLHTRSVQITNISKANPAIVTVSANPFTNGDLILIADLPATVNSVASMTTPNGVTYMVANSTPTSFELQTPAGVNVDSTAYTTYQPGAGGAARHATSVIVGVTSASPAVVTTAAAHSLRNDDIVYLSGFAATDGMIELNHLYARIAVLSPTTFALYNPATGQPVDATSFTPYVSNGRATRQVSVPILDVASSWRTGSAEKLWAQWRLYGPEAAFFLNSITLPFLLRVHAPGASDQTTHFGKIRITAYTTTGISERVYGYRLNYSGTPTFVEIQPAQPVYGDQSDTVVTLEGAVMHGRGAINTEGDVASTSSDGSGLGWVSGAVNERYYVSCDLRVVTSGTGILIRAVVVEVEDWRDGQIVVPA